MRRLCYAATLLIAVACASSRPSGGGVDAAADATGGDAASDDGAVSDDAAVDGAIDGPDDAALDGAIDGPTDAAIDANTCPTQPCALFPQCGCTPPLTCDIDFTDLMGTSCRGVTVPGVENSTCTTFTQCAAGYVCAGGRCHEWCGADSDCSQPRGLCAIRINDGMGAQITPTLTCSANCDPTSIAAGGCPSGQKCGFFTTPRGAGTIRVLDCAVAGTGAQNAACTSDTMCAADFLCSTTTTQACRRVCNRTAGGQECATLPGTSCIGFTTPLTVAGIEYGVCGP